MENNKNDRGTKIKPLESDELQRTGCTGVM